MGEEWTGGDVLKFPGGAQKIILLRRALEALKEQPDRVVMFVDRQVIIMVIIITIIITNIIITIITIIIITTVIIITISLLSYS